MLFNPVWVSHVLVLLWFQTVNTLSLRLLLEQEGFISGRRIFPIDKCLQFELFFK